MTTRRIAPMAHESTKAEYAAPSTAVVTHQAQVPQAAEPFEMNEANPLANVDGSNDLTREDIAIPRLTLVQAQSKNLPDDYMQFVGQWYNTLTGEFVKSTDAILMSVVKGRIAFPEVYAADSDPLCGSDDGVMPRGEYVNTSVEGVLITGPCAECPLSKFAADGTPPLCAMQYSYAMYELNTGLPIIVSAKRTGIVAARQLNTIAKTLGRRRIIRIASKKTQGNQGTYYEPIFSAGEKTPPELIEMVAEMSSAMGGNLLTRMQREQRKPGDESNGFE